MEELVFTGEIKKNAPIEEGEYEVTLSAEWSKTKAGDDFIKIVYEIRKDVEQNEQGRLIFDGVYKDKATKTFPRPKIEAILSTIPKDQQKLRFPNYDTLIQFINGLNMRIEVKTEKADPNIPNSIDKSVCRYLSNKPTTAGPVFSNGLIEDTSIAANDLPF